MKFNLFKRKKIENLEERLIGFCYPDNHPIRINTSKIIKENYEDMEKLLSKLIYFSKEAITSNEVYFPYELNPAFYAIEYAHNFRKRIGKEEIDIERAQQIWEDVFEIYFNKRIEETKNLLEQLKFKNIEDPMCSVWGKINWYGTRFMSNGYNNDVKQRIEEIREEVYRQELNHKLEKLQTDDRNLNELLDNYLSHRFLEIEDPNLKNAKQLYKDALVKKCKEDPEILKKILAIPYRVPLSVPSIWPH